MRKILILGATGKLGSVLLSELLDNGFHVTVLVRSPEKLQIRHKNLNILVGNPTDSHDLSKALDTVDGVVSVLGHGFRTKFPIQEKTLSQLIPLMEKKKIRRFITVTGAALLVKNDPHSLFANISAKVLKAIDPFRYSDAAIQQELLEKSALSWTVVRTPVHASRSLEKIKVGFTQPAPWATISRLTVANFIIDCIEKDSWTRQSPIISPG